MANRSDDEIFGILVCIVIALIALFFIIVYVVAPILAFAAGCGICIGGFNAVYNYSCAFRTNVKPDRVVI